MTTGHSATLTLTPRGEGPPPEPATPVARECLQCSRPALPGSPSLCGDCHEIARSLQRRWESRVAAEINLGELARPAPPAAGTSAIRKAMPLFSGCLAYFPDALLAVAKLSKIGNDKHNPGQPLHWSKDKSADHADCIARHLLEHGKPDPRRSRR